MGENAALSGQPVAQGSLFVSRQRGFKGRPADSHDFYEFLQAFYEASQASNHPHILELT